MKQEITSAEIEQVSEVLPVVLSQIDGENVSSVDGRKLYEFLGIKKQFSDWMKHQISSLNLLQSVDFEPYTPESEKPNGGRIALEYMLITDCAKHIAMASRTDKGHLVRMYFIHLEKKSKAAEILPARRTPEDFRLWTTEMILAEAQRMYNAELEAYEANRIARAADLKAEAARAVADSARVEVQQLTKQIESSPIDTIQARIIWRMIQDYGTKLTHAAGKNMFWKATNNFKDRFGIPRSGKHTELLKSQYEEAKDWLKGEIDRQRPFTPALKAVSRK